jgi:hypothetical protein
MAFLNRIEVSNFIKQRDYDKWVPMILHLVFNFRGHNSLVRMTNGLGKTSIIDGVLSTLGRDHELVSNTRKEKMAPSSTHRFSHIRIESLRRTGPVAQEDMIAKLGIDVPGEKHVFGFFGNSDTGAAHGFYCYRGTLEDCPVAYKDEKGNTCLVDNKTFRERLKEMKEIKISGASFNKNDWLDEVGKHFEISDIEKMTAYQKIGAGDSIQSFYTVNPKGESYGSAFFFTHLAPELLTNIMGEDGEPDEKYLEHTIFNSTIVVRKAQRKCDQEKQILDSLEKKIRLIEPILEKHRELIEAKGHLYKALRSFEEGAQVIEEITVRNQIPGIPSIKLPEDEKAALISESLVLQDGKWFIPDRMLAEICTEEVSEINRRASRKGIYPLDEYRAQVIENIWNTAHKRRVLGGIPNKLYSDNMGVQLLSLAPHFKQGWTKETARDTMGQAFKWAETADTNVFRREMQSMEVDIGLADKRIKELGVIVDSCDKTLKDLSIRSNELSESEAAYKKMKESPFFTAEELKMPAETGKSVADALEKGKKDLEDHIRKAGEFKTSYEKWKKLTQTYGKGFDLTIIINELESAIRIAKEAWDKKRNELSLLQKDKEENRKKLDESNETLSEGEKKIAAFEILLPSLTAYQRYFADMNPSGLKERIDREFKKVSGVIENITKNMAVWKQDMEALKTFRKKHGETDPWVWIDEQIRKIDALKEKLRTLKNLETDLVRRRRELDSAQVASGDLYSKALDIAGKRAAPLYKVAEGIDVSAKRRALVLTAFSSFLFAPVFDALDEATACAKMFYEKKVEVPVFVQRELEIFFREGDISEFKKAAHTYFLGIRTRPVDCLLNPSLIEGEKKDLDKEILDDKEDIKHLEKEIKDFNTESADMQTARKAARAVNENIEGKYIQAESDIEEKQKNLATLQEQSQNLYLIDNILKLKQMGGREQYENLKRKLQGIKKDIEEAKTIIGDLEIQINGRQQEEDEAQKAYTRATEKNGNISELKDIQQFIKNDGPGFMEKVKESEEKIKGIIKTADERSRFEFTKAQVFIDNGGPAAAEIIGQEIEEASNKRNDADSERTSLHVKRRQMDQTITDLRIGAAKLDDYARTLIKKYFTVARIRTTLQDKGEIDVSESEILTRIRKEIKLITGNPSKAEVLNYIGKLVEEAESINLDSLRGDIEQKAKNLKEKKAAFSNGIDRACKNNEAGLSEPDRIWLNESKENPEKVQKMYEAWDSDLNNRKGAHEMSVRAVEQSRSELTQRLVSLISRLTDNYEILCNTVKWKERSDGTKEPGYQISAKIIGMEELPALIENIILSIETDAKRREEDREAGLIESTSDDYIHKRIKGMFYRQVFKNPEIHVYIQELSKRPIVFSDKFSAGQRMAHTLLWMLKIADFAVEKSIRLETSSTAQRKKLRTQQERMFIIDGIFSNISNRPLIKETLSAIGKLKTKIQLIGFYHNPVDVNDENIFPVYIYGDQVRSPKSPTGFVYLKDGKMVSPEEMGVSEGQVETIETHFDKIDEPKKKVL